MIDALHGLLLAAALALSIPVAVLLVETLSALAGGSDAPDAPGPRPRIAVVVPAHDEAEGIVATLRGVLAQLGTGDRLLVVADNCTDDTARLAREAGAEVVERHDPQRRGKGYALDRGIAHLRADPPEVLVVVDADCTLAPDALERVAALAAREGRPVQALYLMHAPADAGLGQRLAAFAWLVKNHVRPLGAARLGLPCQLMGTGMAFPWALVGQASWATGHIAEDVLFGVELALAGAPPVFCPGATVRSRFAASREGAASQRRRWEHGNLGLMLSHAPRLLRAGLARGNHRLVGMALDLGVPPLALLGLLLAATTAAAGVLARASGMQAALLVAAAASATLVLSVGLAWVRFGRGVVSIGQLACAPWYALSKLPLYIAFLARRQTDWVRTRRGE